MQNLLRFARTQHGQLEDNEAHAFAARHALCHYATGVIYTFIPKNACTTMRFTLAIENGCIRGDEDFGWVHANNFTFGAELRDLASARASFVILRCPFARLASLYLDKVVRNVPPARLLLKLMPNVVDVGDLTFRMLADAMKDPIVRRANPHWREQDDFLVFEKYSAYLRVEAFDEAVSEIQRISGMTVRDARALSQHGLDNYALDGAASYCDVPARDIAKMMEAGRAPAKRALYDDAIIAQVRDVYAPDIALYTRLFGARDLMFA